ncbi:hypothetical protein CMI37_09515 [Candidatus Pacearchaeota archaeon]|nr:hypothetical protein [Candidatus Pacearchaeota archaeon]
MTAPHTTYLQGSFRATAAATVRFTDDPGGTPTTSDWTVTAGDTWNSLDELVAAFSAQIVSDLGAGYTVAMEKTGTSTGRLTVDTPANNFSITWSQTGDGTDLRDALGPTGDVANQASGWESSEASPLCFYPQYAGRAVRRGISSRHRAHVLTVGGNSRTQGHADPADVDVVDMDCVLWFGKASDRRPLQQLRDFVEAVFTEDGAGEPFSVFDDSDQWVCRFRDNPVRVAPRRVTNAASDGLWEVTLPLVSEVHPW